jgi:hypothetical protein
MVVRWLMILLTAFTIQPLNNPVQFTVPGITVSPSNTIDLPVTIQTNGNILGSLEFELRYDQNILQFTDIIISEKAQEWLTYTMDGGNGRVRWGGYDKTYGQYAISNPTELFIIRFTVLDPNWTTTPITIGRKTAGDVPGWDIPVLNTDGYINQNRMALPLAEDGIHGKAYPIPTNDIVTVEASLPHSGDYQIILYDLNSNILQNRKQRYVKGMITLEESLTAYPSGVYLLQIASDKFAKTLKLIKN